MMDHNPVSGVGLDVLTQWEIGVLFGYKLDVIKKKWIYFRYAMDTVQT